MVFTRRRRINVGTMERRVSLVAGGLLALYALRRSLGHLLLLGLGGYLLYRGTTGNCPAYQMLGLSTAADGVSGESARSGQRSPARLRLSRQAPQSLSIEKSVTVNQLPGAVYAYWHNLENLPRFMDHVESVTDLGNRRSHWVASAPVKAEWDAEVFDERPNELICWRSLPGSRVDTAGTVSFKTAPDGFGTEIHVKLQYSPPGGRLGMAAAGLLRGVTAQQVHEDLRRFKEVLETGETASVDGQSSARAGQLGSAGARRFSREGVSSQEDEVQSASEQSFPASDPPGWAMSRPGDD